jgi:hypothetical protein
MKRRWEMGREEMIRKIRAGLWKWLLEIEDDCDCWCCKICSRCQTAQEFKNKGTQEAMQGEQNTPNTQIKSPSSPIKSPEKQSKSSRKKTNPPKMRTKSPRGQPRLPEKQIKSTRRQNKPSQKRYKASDLPRRVNKTRSSTPKAPKNRSFFARILGIIKKSGEAVLKIFKKFKEWIGLGGQKANRQSRKNQKENKGRSFYYKVLRIVKKCRKVISKVFERLGAWVGLNKRADKLHDKSPPE